MLRVPALLAAVETLHSMLCQGCGPFDKKICDGSAVVVCEATTQTTTTSNCAKRRVGLVPVGFRSVTGLDVSSLPCRLRASLAVCGVRHIWLCLPRLYAVARLQMLQRCMENCRRLPLKLIPQTVFSHEGYRDDWLLFVHKQY